VKYKDALTQAMDDLAKNPKTVFLGYNTRLGGRGNGTLVHVPAHQTIEMPVAENLMVGTAIGMSLGGYLPVVFFERFDFVLMAADAIINHLDKIEKLSCGEFAPKVILRVVVGNREKPLFTGPTHTQDYTNMFTGEVDFPVVNLVEPQEIIAEYENAKTSRRSSMLVEYKDFYDNE
jgi:pyruvate/2-oxoglutarate/acetoin dehydrogenase E1 component